MDFTLVSTVFNEAKRIDQTISDLQKQTLQPTEIVITDAGSKDGTYEKLLEWRQNSAIPIRIYQKVRCNVAEGRNLAIKAAKYDLIASMDFGCRYNSRWLNSIISPFTDLNIMVVGGGYTIDEQEIISTAAKAAFLLKKGYQTNLNSESFIPSSRSIAYRKSVFQEIGGYSEWLTLAADDLIFGMIIRKIGYKVFLVKEFNAFWMRHNSDKEYVKEAIRYGLGDGEAKLNFYKFINLILNKFYRFSFVFFLILTSVNYLYFNKIFIISVILTFLFGISFRNYFGILKFWWSIKSRKYNFKILMRAFTLNAKINSGYIRGYFKGYFFSTKEQEINAKKLKQILGNDNL